MKKQAPKNKAVINARKAREQALLVENLHKIPIVSIACEKNGVSRATYYRWRKEDADFATSADEALEQGTSLVNDMAESQLLTAIRDGNLGAVMYWLKHRNANYNNKLEVTAKLKNVDDELTPEQEAAVAEALRLATLTEEEASSFVSSSQSHHESSKADANDRGSADSDDQGPQVPKEDSED